MSSSFSKPFITLTTDFGAADHYVGTMKCVILNICPDARLVDITHQLAPSDLLGAAYAISQTAPFSPQGSIHLVVVDPGVGTSRRALAVQKDGRVFIGPDNGVLSFFLPRPQASPLPGWAVREISDEHLWLPSASATFQGRDVFAPAAAHLAAGNVSWESIGGELQDYVSLAGLIPAREYQGRWSGMVLSVDRFGNIITNFPATLADLKTKPFTLQANAQTLRDYYDTFANAPASDPFVYTGSSGYFEVAINQGNASAALGVLAGDPVSLDLNA